MDNKIKVIFKKLDERAAVPTYGSAAAAGADLRALTDGDVCIGPGETYVVHTGIAVMIPQGLAGFIYARSGLASKSGLAPANKVGVIDSDYRGELMVALLNHSDRPATVRSGDRIAQIVFAPYFEAEFVDGEFDETERGAGGFGSTGTK